MDLTFYKGKKVLITGHTGFKGSWMCRTLIQAGAEVTGYSLEPPTDPNLFSMAEIEDKMNSVIGDIRDLEKLSKVFQEVQPEIVIHLAAQPIVRDSYKDPVYTYETNVMGTVNICECVRRNPCVKSFLNVTTDKVYENNGEVFKHQEYLFGKQSFKMGRVKNKVQVMVVDSPLILCTVYNTDEVLGEDFNKTVLNVFNSYNNRNYLLTRHHSYENEGRFQNEDEAKEVRKEIIDKLNQYNIKYEEIASTELNCEYIVEEVMEEIRDEQ